MFDYLVLHMGCQWAMVLLPTGILPKKYVVIVISTGQPSNLLGC